MTKEQLQACKAKHGIILTIVLLLTLVSCLSTQPTSEETARLVDGSPESGNMPLTSTPSPEMSTPLPSTTPTTLPTATPESTQTATLMPTRTTVPTETATSTALPPPSLTPLPTIPPSQRGERYAELMAMNDGCQLPCWWGLEMGSSTIEEVIQLYAQFEPFITVQDYPGGYAIVTIQFNDPDIEEGIQTRHMFTILNGILIEAEIQVRKYENFTPISLMAQLGQPSEVWLWTIPEPYQGILPASFRFYFPEQGVLSAYREPVRNAGENVEVCFNADGGSILLLWNSNIWNPDGSKDFTERANASSELTLEGHQPISEVSNWDEETLYTNLLNPNSTECLETPSNMWSPP